MTKSCSPSRGRRFIRPTPDARDAWKLVPLGVAALLALAGCSPRGAAPSETSEAPLRVKTAMVQPAAPNALLRLSGVVRAKNEIPLAFQVAGRIEKRHADAGQMVSQDQELFVLDERDFRTQSRSAEAQLRAAEIEVANSQTERERVRGLLASRAVSQQDFDRADTIARASEARLIAARSAVELAQSALEYARLHAPQAGILLEVSGEAGQFVGPGQIVAVMAAEGEREIEVALPSSAAAQPPAAGRAWLENAGAPVQIVLREVAGAADPVSRTWRARYRLPRGVEVPLGLVVRVELDGPPAASDVRRVPLGALDERGQNPQVWIVEDGKAVPRPVQVVEFDDDFAVIRTDLPPGSQVVALGTHLLQPGTPVQPLTP